MRLGIRPPHLTVGKEMAGQRPHSSPPAGRLF